MACGAPAAAPAAAARRQEPTRHQPGREAGNDIPDGHVRWTSRSEVKTFQPVLSARYGEKHTNMLYCAYSRNWRDKSSFSAEQRSTPRDLRYSLAFSYSTALLS